MSKTIVFEGVRHVFPDDFTDADIQKALSGSPAPKAASAPGARPRFALSAGPFGLTVAPEEAAGPIGRFLTNALPSIGAMAAEPASLLAGPAAPLVAPPLAAGGSFLGSLGQSAIQGQPFDPRQAWEQAKMQALFSGAGGLGVATSKGLARAGMQMALRPARGMTRMAPDIVNQTLEAGGTVMPVGPKFLPAELRGGSAASGEAMGAAGRATKQAISNADMAATTPLPGGAGVMKGARVRLSSLLPKAKDVVPAQAAHVGDDIKAARAEISAIGRNHPGVKNLQDLKDMKVELFNDVQGILEKIFPGSKKPVAAIIAQAPIEARVKYATAQNIKTFLESVPGSGHPGGIGAAEAATQRAINANRAIVDAENAARSGVSRWIPATVGRSSAAATGAVVGAGANREHPLLGAAEGGLAGALLTHPAVASRGAQVLNNPYLLWLLSQTPRAVGTMGQ